MIATTCELMLQQVNLLCNHPYKHPPVCGKNTIISENYPANLAKAVHNVFTQTATQHTHVALPTIATVTDDETNTRTRTSIPCVALRSMAVKSHTQFLAAACHVVNASYNASNCVHFSPPGHFPDSGSLLPASCDMAALIAKQEMARRAALAFTIPDQRPSTHDPALARMMESIANAWGASGDPGDGHLHNRTQAQELLVRPSGDARSRVLGPWPPRWQADIKGCTAHAALAWQQRIQSACAAMTDLFEPWNPLPTVQQSPAALATW